MSDKPIITVITISYNSSQFIGETIESVLSQEYENFEYVICDDCSRDNTWELIKKYDDPRIRSFRNENNMGEYANRNKCVEIATGDFLIFIDGDDIMYPHALTIFLKYAKDFPDCGMVIARDWDYRILCPYKVLPVDFFRFEYFDSSILGNFTKIFFKTSVIKNNPFPLHIKTGDTYIQLKIGQNHSVLLIPDGLTWWRQRSGNATSQLFVNYRYNAEKTNYQLDLLKKECPLDSLERDLAMKNVYGIHLRLVIRLFFRMRFSDSAYLFRQVQVPVSYAKSVFIPRIKGYFNKFNGNKPFHSGIFG